MKKLLFTLLLAAISSHALADWKLIATDEEKTNFFIDPNSIKKYGSRVIVLELTSYATPQTYIDANKPYLSLKSKVAYDCKNKTQKYLFIKGYEDEMGKSKEVYVISSKITEYTIPPESIASALIKAVCSKD